MTKEHFLQLLNAANSNLWTALDRIEALQAENAALKEKVEAPPKGAKKK